MTTKFDYLFKRVYQRAFEAYNFLQERYAKYLSLSTIWSVPPYPQFCFRVDERVLGLSLNGISFYRITDFRAPNAGNLLFLERFVESFDFVRNSLQSEYSDLCDRSLAILRTDKLNF